MKRIVLVIILLMATSIVYADTWVNGYYKPSSGRWVQGYFRTDTNQTRLDNYSTEGNVNPYTGQKGYKPLYKTYEGYTKPKHLGYWDE